MTATMSLSSQAHLQRNPLKLSQEPCICLSTTQPEDLNYFRGYWERKLAKILFPHQPIGEAFIKQKRSQRTQKHPLMKKNK